MYGTIARIKALPGKAKEFDAIGERQARAGVPGWVTTLAFRSDSDPDEIWIAVAFESKEAYLANANSPEQQARFQQFRALTAADPEWHDGEVTVHASPAVKALVGARI